MFSPAMQQLLETLRCLPGVGPRTAQRMMLHLLERDRAGGNALSSAIAHAMEVVGHCKQCRTFAEQDYCPICMDKGRSLSQLCIVESPADMIALESSGSYRGYYFILLGHLSPLDGIGPEQLGIDQLLEKLDEHVEEVILATNPTVEGEATAHYISEVLKEYKEHIQVTRIAHGVPVGGELEFVDSSTLIQALDGRHVVKQS